MSNPTLELTTALGVPPTLNAYGIHLAEDVSPDLDLLLDFIRVDERPTLLVESPQPDYAAGRVVYRNPALTHLLSSTGTLRDFGRWTENITAQRNSKPANGLVQVPDAFAGVLWHSKALKGGYIAVHADQATRRPSQHDVLRDGDVDRDTREDRRVSTQRDGVVTTESDEKREAVICNVDGTADDDKHPPASHAGLSTVSAGEGDGQKELEDYCHDFLHSPDATTDPWIKSFITYNWSATKFGAIEDWDPALRSAVVSMLHCPDPRTMYWGNDMLLLYNEAGQCIPGRLHPAFGRSFLDLFGPESHTAVKSTIIAAVARGKSDWLPEARFVMDTEGIPEERFFRYYILPISGHHGRFGGALVSFKEITDSVRRHDRTDALAFIARNIASAGSLIDFWSRIPSVIATCGSQDIAYALLYMLDGTGRTASDSGRSEQHTPVFRLGGSYGIPTTTNVEDVPQMLSEEFAEAAKHEDVIIWETDAGSLPQALAINVAELGTVRQACIVTISNAWRRELAYLVIGVHPQRPFDAGQRDFLLELRDLFSRAAAFRDFSEPRRLEGAPDLHLDAPIGLVKFVLDGSILYANDSYFEIFNSPRCDNLNTVMAESVFPEDLEACREALLALASGKGGTWSTRLKATARAPHTGQRWVESVVIPERDSKGEIGTFTCWAVDITDRKCLEKLLAQRLQDAIEVKRAAERFTDTLSHELRNPLSAILQSADGIMSSLAHRSSNVMVNDTDDIIEAAKTIMLCAQHQKNIVDDVLTLSKLDSDLVILTPDPIKPSDLLQRAQKMFDAQLKSAHVAMSIEIHKSIVDLHVDHVLIDSRRVLQIIINLLSNAIKFVSFSSTREISLELSAFQSRPSLENGGTEYLAPRFKVPATMSNQPPNTVPSTEHGGWVYLQYTVRDSGSGMTDEEMRKLFQRFSQASPKTTTQYGGTGLGLFISRELAELHGGQIGLTSKPGLGSTFTFYVRAQRVAKPTTPLSIEEARSTPPLLRSSISTKDLTVLRTHYRNPPLRFVANENPVVEDNAINQKVMARQLRAAGFKDVHVADHGLDALEFLAKTVRHPAGDQKMSLDVVLLDVEMPVMDGLTAARRIRDMESRLELNGHVPIIGITANARKEQINAALVAGMDTVVTKPFLIPDLVPRITALVCNNEGGEGDRPGGGHDI